MAVWAVDADWGRRTVTLDVPALVADRLLGPSSSMTCEPFCGEADPVEPSRGPVGRQGTVSPGVFDDTRGARQAVRHTYRDAEREPNLRLLALARGVHDLRSLDAGRDRVLPLAVWQGLLAHDQLDLAPFREPSADRWRSGSGVPLGPLAVAQIYTTNADPRIEGKGHSPLCRHAGERGVAASDDLVTIVDLLARDDFDWCSKCAGYAVRSLTDTQLSYYRAAHRLHDIARQLGGDSGHHDTIDTDTVISQLEVLADWQPIDEEGWYTSDSWRWREAIRNIRHKAERTRRHDAS